MNKTFFTRLLEIIWLFVGMAAAFASVNSFIHNSTKDGYTMAMFSCIGFFMFYVRRNIRLKRKNEMN